MPRRHWRARIARQPRFWRPSARQFRRFESIAFDQFGYFSQSVSLSRDGSTTTGGSRHRLPITVANAEPAYGGSLFVSDLASGLYVSVTPGESPVPDDADPSSRSRARDHRRDDATRQGTSSRSSPMATRPAEATLGGRILRVLPNGTVNTFAYGFDTSGPRTTRASSTRA